MGQEGKKQTDGRGMGIREGMHVYGLLLSSDGYFSAEGTVTGADGNGFRVKYKMLETGYKYSDIGRNVYLDKETAAGEAETMQYEKEKAAREDFWGAG